jgi:hypothetical protein
MTPEAICERALYDLDRLALTLLENGRRGAAFKVIELACGLCGEKCYDEDSPLEVVQKMANGEGGAV